MGNALHICLDLTLRSPLLIHWDPLTLIFSGFPLFRTDKIPCYFHDFSRFFSKFPGIFSLFLKNDFQVVWNINMLTY